MVIKRIFYLIVNIILSVLIFVSFGFLLFFWALVLLDPILTDDLISSVFIASVIAAVLITKYFAKSFRRKYTKTTIAIPEECFDQYYHSKAETRIGLQEIDIMEGHDFEHWCAVVLRNNGFDHVEVTPPSGDHGVDVLAQKDGIKYAIQCKRYSYDLDNTPVQEVYAGKAMYNCHVGVVMTNRYFTEGAKRLAEVNGVLLWDRDWIMEHTEAPESVKDKSNTFLFFEYTDELFPDAAEIVLDAGFATPELISDQLSIGYSRAYRILEELESKGVVGPFCGSQHRSVLISREDWDFNK